MSHDAREAVARIIDPQNWEMHDWAAKHSELPFTVGIDLSLEKADAILATLSPDPALLGEVREALERLEAANEALCRVRSRATYDQMMADCSAAELYDLDEARAHARTLLAKLPKLTGEEV